MEPEARQKRDYLYNDLTQGMCRQCRILVDAQILFRDGSVYLRTICPVHGASEALIARSAQWYWKTVNSRQLPDRPKKFSTQLKKGCPFDCGLCSWHEKACHLPIFSITNACNLKCPICFTYNRDDRKYFMPEEEFRSIVDWIIESEGEIDLINITGGEPTLHPNLPGLLHYAKRKGIGRITVNSNGIRLANDERLVEELAREGVYIVLSFNTFRSDVAIRMHGSDIFPTKLEALRLLEKHNVQTTILNVAAKGINDDEIGNIIELLLSKDFIRSVTIQTMTFTGFGGGTFSPRKRLPLDEAIDAIVQSHPSRFRQDDFVPLPGTHPLCYSICYLFVYQDIVLPLRRLFEPEEFEQIIGVKYLMRPGDRLQKILMEKINELWSRQDGDSDAGRQLRFLKHFISALYPAGKNLTAFERQKIAEQYVKTIYIHSHMDEETFDVSRVIRCGDLVPDSTKTFIPACSYNLFYRMKDSRFWREDAGIR